MTSTIAHLLSELYALDPTLREHEATLIPLLTRLQASRPSIKPDAAFVARLRTELLAHAQNHVTQQSPSVSSPLFSSFSSFLTMQKFSYAIAGALVGIFVATPTVYLTLTRSTSPLLPSGQVPMLDEQITRGPSEAFGDLSTVSPVAGGRGGGGGGVAYTEASPPMNTDADSKIGMIAPAPMTQYHYVYKGDALSLPTGDTVDVLKRTPASLGTDGIGQLLSMNFGVVDLASFKGMKLESFNLFQDSKKGYSVYVNARDGSVSINQNWEQWDHPESRCTDDRCFAQYRLTQDDIPADEQLIAIAQAFLSDHGIALDQFGTPEIDKSWRMYMPTESSAEMYVPDTITVLYPLLVDGQTVYDEGGTKSGINVAVNIRHKAVGGVWSLTSQNYMSSGYDAVQDEQQILSYIDAFEQYATDYLPPEMKIEKKELELGTPAQGYVNMYRMLDQHSEQLLVPALIFPVLNAPEDQPWFRKNVIVPLAADLLARQDMGRPMPLDAVR